MLLGCGLFLELSFLLILQQLSRSTPSGAALLLLVACYILYLVSVFTSPKLLNRADCNGLCRGLILGFALLFRLTLAPAPVVYSDDLYRYRWEGVAQLAGVNPYATAPLETQVARDETFSKVVGRDFRGGYGPLQTLVERGMASFCQFVGGSAESQVLWFKLPTALADVLLGLLWWRRLGPGALVYLWCPLPVFEFWGHGHNDALALAAVVTGLLLADKERWAWSWGALGLAVAVKWWPLVLGPVWFWRTRGWAKLWSGLAVVIPAILLLPYWTDFIGNAKFMTGFLGGWRNQDVLFGSVLQIPHPRMEDKHWAELLIAAVVLAISLSKWDRWTASFASMLALLVLSANLHPWYLTWLVALLPMVTWTPVLLWISLSPLLYEPVFLWHLTGAWNGLLASRWWVHGPFLGYAAAKYAKRIANKMASRMVNQLSREALPDNSESSV